MRKLDLALFALVLLAFSSCNKGITPVTEKIDGPLGPYFEVVSQPYQANEAGVITIDLKRIKDGLPAPWEEGLKLGKRGDFTYEASLNTEFFDKEGKICGGDKTDVLMDAEALMKLVNLKVGETGPVSFVANLENAKQFKMGSDFLVRMPTEINLSGNIGTNLPICMSLYISYDGETRGAYYYKKNGPNALLFLKGWKDGDDLPLMEYNKNGKHTGEYEGTFTGKRYKGEFEAFTGKTYPFDLNEDKNMEFIDFGGVDFDMFYETDFYVRETPIGSFGTSNWDEILDRYERVVNEYVRLYKKVQAGDYTAAAEMASIAEDYEELSEALDSARGSMTPQQANRLLMIQNKLLQVAY